MSQTLYEKSTLTLELPQVLEKIAAYAVSDGAKAMLLAMRPYTYLDDIRAKMREITDALALMRTRSAPMFSGLSDVTVQLRRVEIGGSLSPGELLKILRSAALRPRNAGIWRPGRPTRWAAHLSGCAFPGAAYKPDAGKPDLRLCTQ